MQKGRRKLIKLGKNVTSWLGSLYWPQTTRGAKTTETEKFSTRKEEVAMKVLLDATAVAYLVSQDPEAFAEIKKAAVQQVAEELKKRLRKEYIDTAVALAVARELGYNPDNRWEVLGPSDFLQEQVKKLLGGKITRENKELLEEITWSIVTAKVEETFGEKIKALEQRMGEKASESALQAVDRLLNNIRNGLGGGL